VMPAVLLGRTGAWPSAADAMHGRARAPRAYAKAGHKVWHVPQQVACGAGKTAATGSESEERNAAHRAQGYSKACAPVDRKYRRSSLSPRWPEKNIPMA
jgi:hypothetical protein